jgi:hypothetical protein
MTFHEALKLTQHVDHKETGNLISIDYFFKGKPKVLIVDKQENTDLMELVDGEVSQYDAIKLAAMHEVNISNRGYLDFVKPGSLFEEIAALARRNNEILYGVNY